LEKKMLESAQAFIFDEQGVTAIEYGLIAALIGILITVAAANIGTSISALFVRIAGCIANPFTTC
jgi:pilus assembly protein Flp/PilA